MHLQIEKMVHGKTGLSQRKIGKTFGVSQQGVSSLFKRVGLHYFKRSVVPKVTKAHVMSSFPHEFFYGALSVLVASAKHSCMKVELLPMFFTKT